MRPLPPGSLYLLGALVLLVVSAQPASGQTRPPDAAERWLSERWTVDDGLPVNHGTSLHQTSDGYLWMSTFDGLVRFDGTRFRIFNATDTAGLPSNRLTKILPVWDSPDFFVVTEAGQLVRYHNGAFQPMTGGITGQARDALASSDTSGWIVGERLWRYSGGQVEQIPIEGELGSGGLRTVWRDATGAVWVRDWADTRTWRVSGGRALRVDPAGAPRPPQPAHHPPYGPLPERCSDGASWQTADRTLLRDGRVVAELPSLPTHLLCDREGSLWVTTRRSGLMRFYRSSIETFSAEDGLGLSNVYSIFEDRYGGMWIAGEDDVTSRLHAGRVRDYRIWKDDVHVPREGLFEDRDGTFWHGLYSCPSRLRTADGGCRRFEWTVPVPTYFVVHAITQTRDGALWFGGYQGLTRFFQGDVTRFSTVGELPLSSVRYLLEARDGTLYAATNGAGVARVNGRAVSALTTADGLPSNQVRALLESARGTLWIGTEDAGLAHYDSRTDSVTVVDERHGLYYNGIHQIVEDAYGRFWMSTNRGLFWVWGEQLEAFVRGEIDQVKSVVYTERDGLRNRELNGGNQYSAFKASDGRIWFASQDGVVIADPSRVPAASVRLDVVAEGVSTAQNTYGVHSSGEVGQPAHVSLSLGEREFRIAYTSPTFAHPEQVRFRYRLAGFDEAWVEAGTRREAVFTNVPPGDYRFDAAASVDGAAWTEAALLTLSVGYRWYETPGFLVACGLLAVLALFGLYRLRLAQLIGQQRRLDEQVTERTRALREEKRKTEEQALRLLEMDHLKSRFFTNVSHEFRTPLTLTIGPLEDLERGGTLGREDRELVGLALRNSRRLLRLIGQLLDTARFDVGALRLDARVADLRAFSRACADLFVALAERRRIRFVVDLPANPVLARFDAEKLEQVAVNLLSNAFKFTPPGGSVRLSLTAPDRNAVLRVSDTGRGIAPDHLPHLFDRFHQAPADSEVQPGSGIGLSLAHNLVELHGGELTAESTLGEGSAFELTLPLAEASALAAPALVDPVRLGSTAEPDVVPFATISPVVTDAAARASMGDGSAPDDENPRPVVLVADDNDDIRAYIRRHFEVHFRIVEAADGVQALGRVREWTPDLVVSDVMMPRLDGFSLCRTLKSDAATDFIPVLLLTAKATIDEKLDGLDTGADDYLSKPFDMRELLARARNLIALRSRLRERLAGLPAAHPGEHASSLPATGNAQDDAFLGQLAEATRAQMADEDFGIEALALALDVSRTTLYRRVRDLLQTTPSGYLRDARIRQARALLATGEGSIGEVAYAAGFRSVSYFSRVFREETGMTPTEFVHRTPQAEQVDFGLV